MVTGNLPGDTASYSCDHGFALIGAARLTCEDNGMWSDFLPTCQKIGMKNAKHLFFHALDHIVQEKLYNPV